LTEVMLGDTQRRTRLRAWPAVLALLLVGVPGPAAGQAAEQTADSCPLGRISFIFVDSHDVFDADELAGGRAFRWAYRIANAIHMTTRESFLLSEVLFSLGDCYDPELLADSERVLRRYGHLARVEIYGLRQADDSWHVIVDTQDQWTTQLNVRFNFEEGIEFRGLDLSEENVLGRGLLLGAFMVQRDEQRDVGGRFSTPRVLGTRLDALVTAGKTRVGGFYEHELSFPFVGEVGRVAGRHRFTNREGQFTYWAGDSEGEFSHVLLPVDERFFELSVARRLGDPGRLTVFGLGLSSIELDYPGFPEGVEVGTGGDFDGTMPAPPAVAALVEEQTRFTSATRLTLLVGQRHLGFQERTGLDALRGIQDVPVGLDVAVAVGRSLGTLVREGDADDFLTRVRLLAGATPGPSVLNLDVRLEGRRILSGQEPAGGSVRGWRDVTGEFHGLVYVQPSAWPSHTFFARASGAGGWSMDVPFQLTLGGPAGLRGYHTDEFPGGRRLSFSVEDRVYLGWPARDLFDLGLTLFADLGRMWPGDAPFGRDSGWRGSVGGGLRVGFPAGTRGVVRLDFGFPVDGSGLGGMVFRVSAFDRLGLQRLSDRQLLRSLRHGGASDGYTGGR
jgi:hypothetical protein